MTLYTYLAIEPSEIAALTSEEVDVRLQSRLATKISEPQPNSTQELINRSIERARIAAYVLGVPELRSAYDTSIAGLPEADEKALTQSIYDDGKNTTFSKTSASALNPVSSIRPELITSQIEINFLLQRYKLSDEQIASIANRLPEIATASKTCENIFGLPDVGEKTVEAALNIVRTQPENAHLVLGGIFQHLDLSDRQLAEAIRKIPETQIDKYDVMAIFSQPNFRDQSLEATLVLIKNDSLGLGRHIVREVARPNRLSDSQLAQVIDTIPENQDFETSLHSVVSFAYFGPESASAFLKRIVDAKLRDDELTLPLVESNALNGDQLAQLLVRNLDSERLSNTQRKILAKADRHQEIKRAFMKSVKDTRELNTEALEILAYQAPFEDHEIAAILSQTVSSMQKREAERTFLSSGVRFGPEAIDVIVQDVDGIQVRTPQSLERILMGTSISDAQTAKLLVATITDQEAYEMWDVIAQYGEFGDQSMGVMASRSHQMPNLRPSFIRNLADSYSPHPIPDQFAATVLATTKHTVLANDLRIALVEKQQLGRKTFDELTKQFNATQNVDKHLVYQMISRNRFDDEQVSQLIQSTQHAHAGSEIRSMIAGRQQLGPRAIAAMTGAMRASQYPQEELETLSQIARNGMHEDGRRMIAGAFQNSHLAERVNQIMGIDASGQNFGQSSRSW